MRDAVEYGEKQHLSVACNANVQLLVDCRFGPRADEHARDDGHGKLRRLFVVGNKHRTQDNFGIHPNDPYLVGKELELNVSWDRFPGGNTTERPTWW